MFDLESKVSTENQSFCARPGFGREGKHIRVRTNFFELKSFIRNTVYHYDLTFTGEIPTRLIKKIYNELVRQYGREQFGTVPVFDGRRNIFSSTRLSFGENIDLVVELPNERGRRDRETPKFKVSIKKVREIKMEELYQYLKGDMPQTPSCMVAVMALEIAFKYKPSNEHVTIGRNFFVPDNSRAISGGLEIWQGYFQSCKPTLNRMLINIDTAATCFYQPIGLADFVTKLLDRRDPRDFQRGISDRDIQKINSVLKSVLINVIHRETYRPYKILGFTQRAANNDYFKVNDEDPNSREISVSQYFEQKYNTRLNFPFLPCVLVTKNGSKLPLEVCKIVPGQRYMKKLNQKQTQDMIKFTSQKPNVKANQINTGIKLLKHDDNKYLDQFGVKINPGMLNINARILQVPTLNYHRSSNTRAQFQPSQGSWNMRNLRVASGATLASWGVVVMCDPRDISEHAVQRFIKEFVVTCQDTGMDIPSKQPPIGYCNPNGNIEKESRDHWLRTGNTYQMEPQLLVFILPNTAEPLYAEIKRVCDTIIGVSSQCLQASHVSSPKKQYCANVCLKVNVKLGGVNTHLNPEDIPFISQVPTIVLGADVTHPGPGDSSRPSIATLVGSVDARVAKYCASVRTQSGRSEVIADLASMVVEIFKKFYETSKRKPQRILLYRDGVSDGQFSEVLRNELEAIRTACARLETGYQPSITFIIVKKRHHARFFPIEHADSDKSGNLIAGTVIDQEITHPREFDFYLQSHSGLLGTARSAHYYVLYDENNFTSDKLQTLTYNLCYLFSRCTKSVSLVPPVYYAHLVAARARFHSRSGTWSDIEAKASQQGDISSYGDVKESISSKMYFV